MCKVLDKKTASGITDRFKLFQRLFSVVFTILLQRGAAFYEPFVDLSILEYWNRSKEPAYSFSCSTNALEHVMLY